MLSRQDGLFVAMSMTLAAATFSLVMRLVARKLTKVPLWWDDFLCLGAFIFGLSWCASLLVWVQFGFGLPLKDAPLDPVTAMSNALFFCYLAEILYGLSLACSKLAVLAFYWRMFKTSSIRIPIITLAVLSIAWLLIRTVIGIFHCLPVRSFWDKSIPNSKCYIDDSKFFLGTVLSHFVLDLAILALPIIQVRKLQLRTAKKVGVISLFMFGILVCMASIAVIVLSVSYNTSSPEVSLNVAEIMVWATVEVNLAVVSACLPMLRPVFMRAYHRMFPDATMGSSDRFNSTQTKPYHLSKMANKNNTVEDTESTHKLVYSNSSAGKKLPENSHVINGSSGLRVVITGNERSSAVVPISSSPLGIIVKSETSVQVHGVDE